MGFQALMVHHSPVGREPAGLVARFAADRNLRVETLTAAEDVVTLVNRGFPACIVMDGSGAECVELCRTLKTDAFSAIVPVVFVLDGEAPATLALRALEAGADEVLTDRFPAREAALRLHMTLHRAARDVSVNPTTRLPGTAQIERDIAERLRRGETFAVCYADLDYFKEYNDRYGYNEGDRVIRMLSRILRDVVKAYAPAGFIGHIGGDDFIFNVPLDAMRICCEEILEIFDELVPYQYSEQDRGAGYFLGKDRRGIVHRIPIMTLSIGVVTNQHRSFAHTARMSEVATEMKTYAKTLPGSVYAVDRRRDSPAEGEPAEEAVRAVPHGAPPPEP